MNTNLAQSHIKKMGLYEPPPDARLDYDGVLLDFNEKTIPPSRAVQEALKSVIDKGIVQIYPQECLELREAIAEYCGVAPNQILLTNGSDQAIDVIFRTFTKPRDRVIIPCPTYSMFGLFAELMDVEINQPVVELPDLSFPKQGVLDALTKHTSLIVVCSPNNPTGQLISNETIQELASTAPNTLIYVDEAYYEFSQQTAVPLLEQYSNIVISRTFSKAFGLAGLRIGYVIASPEHIAEMEKVRNPYDINIFAYYGARAALDNLDELNSYVTEVMQQAKPLIENFFQESGIRFFSSQANFILFQVKNSKTVYEKLRSLNILVRPRSGPFIDNTIRLTIGTLVQMEQFIEMYKEKILCLK